MKQNPSEANQLLVLLLAFTLLSVGCVRRTHQQPSASSRVQVETVNGRRININSATAEELRDLPGIGQAISERIVKHRSQHGPFRRAEHIMLVPGISERKFLDIESLITVD